MTARAGDASAAVAAGFWHRYAAWSLDAALAALPAWALVAGPATRALADAAASLQRVLDAQMQALAASARDGDPILTAMLRLLRDPAVHAASTTLQADAVRAAAWPLAAFALVLAVLHVAGERSRWRGSPGKRALGLVVVDADGRRLGTGRALGRFVAGGASWLTLNGGHLLALRGPQHLALHDRLSATRVRATATAPLPGWARAWIALQLVLGVVAGLFAARGLAAAIVAATARAMPY